MSGIDVNALQVSPNMEYLATPPIQNRSSICSSQSPAASLTASVIVVTVNRPDCVQRCLAAIQLQVPRPVQIIVIDSSHDERTRHVVAHFPDVIYLAKPELFGQMTASRNAALLHASGDIIAFLDDDAYAHPDWLKHLLLAYDSPHVGAVGGRALNGQPGEEHLGNKQIGRLDSNGFLTGNFAADPGTIVDVDHIIGCNMSFRREILAELGGFREDFAGISGLCEDTDMSLRVTALGFKIRFQPKACVDHVGAPQAYGRRFDSRYQFYHRRNSFVLLLRNFGWSSIILRFPFAIAAQAFREFLRNQAQAAGRLLASFAGLALGFVNGLKLYLKTGTDPVRHDSAADTIRLALSSPRAQDSATTSPVDPR